METTATSTSDTFDSDSDTDIYGGPGALELMKEWGSRIVWPGAAAPASENDDVEEAPNEQSSTSDTFDSDSDTDIYGGPGALELMKEWGSRIVWPGAAAPASENDDVEEAPNEHVSTSTAHQDLYRGMDVLNLFPFENAVAEHCSSPQDMTGDISEEGTRQSTSSLASVNGSSSSDDDEARGILYHSYKPKKPTSPSDVDSVGDSALSDNSDGDLRGHVVAFEADLQHADEADADIVNSAKSEETLVQCDAHALPPKMRKMWARQESVPVKQDLPSRVEREKISVGVQAMPMLACVGIQTPPIFQPEKKTPSSPSSDHEEAQPLSISVEVQKETVDLEDSPSSQLPPSLEDNRKLYLESADEKAPKSEDISPNLVSSVAKQAYRKHMDRRTRRMYS